MTVEEMMSTGNLVRLNSSDEYQKYFDHMKRVFEIVVEWYTGCVKDGGREEARIMMEFTKRILYTIQTLSLKFSFSAEHQLALDLNDSGYPHLLGIMELENDLRVRDETLKKLIRPQILRDQMIDAMLRDHIDPDKLLWQCALYEYFCSLDANQVILPFTVGDLSVIEQSDRMRRYLFSWLCYDFITNVPYVHIMVFDQDKAEEAVHEKGAKWNEFLDVVKANGSRIPSMLLLARGIDASLPNIHPKVIKRIKFGPIGSKEYSKENVGTNPFIPPLLQFGEGDDFVMRLRHEIINSTGQVDERKGFLSNLKPAMIREIFAVNLSDEECSEAQATEIRRQVILPHRLTQHMKPGDPAFGKYKDADRIAYNNGEVFVL